MANKSYGNDEYEQFLRIPKNQVIECMSIYSKKSSKGSSFVSGMSSDIGSWFSNKSEQAGYRFKCWLCSVTPLREAQVDSILKVFKVILKIIWYAFLIAWPILGIFSVVLIPFFLDYSLGISNDAVMMIVFILWIVTAYYDIRYLHKSGILRKFAILVMIACVVGAIVLHLQGALLTNIFAIVFLAIVFAACLIYLLYHRKA